MIWIILTWLRRLLALGLITISFLALLQVLDTVRDGFIKPWIVLTNRQQASFASMSSLSGAAESRPIIAVSMPTRQPTSTPTPRPSPTPTPTPRYTPALSALRVDPLGPTPTAARANEPFKHSGTIEAMDGKTWTISGQQIFMPFPIRGTPRIGAAAEAEGIIRADGVWEAKVLRFSP